jgi:hypothetical protein
MSNKKSGRQILSNWLVDVSKYLATAIVLATVFKDISGWLIYALGSVLVILVLGLGIFLNKKEN